MGLVSTFIFVGCSCSCSCSSKKIKPTGINVDVTEKVLFVGDSFDVNYNITPVDSSNTKVNVSVNTQGVVSLSATSFDSATGKVTITANGLNQNGVAVTFNIEGTSLSATTTVKVMPDPQQLGAPSEVYYSNVENAIKFKNVANANKYVVDIDGVEYVVNDPSTSTDERYLTLNIFNSAVPVTYNQKHIVKVKAIGDGINYSNSNYSGEYKFIKYGQVSNLASNNGVITWDAHAISQTYSVKVNNQVVEPSLNTNSYTLAPATSGEYEVQVAAVGSAEVDQEGYAIFNSAFSNVISIKQLESSTLRLNNENIVDQKIGNGVLVITPAAHATGYRVKVSPAIEQGVEFVTESNLIEIDDRFEVGTTYNFEVTPIGDTSKTIEGKTTYITIKKLGYVDTISIQNNVLTFNGIVDASKYEVALISDNDVKTVTTTSTSVNLAEQLPGVGQYSISVRAIGLVTEVINVANGIALNTEKTITKLQSVNALNTVINNDGTVTWQEVSGVTNYAVYLDDVYVNTVNQLTYKLEPSAILSGGHQIKIVTIGDGVQTISSGLNNATPYEFNKLSGVQSYFVENDTLNFEGVANAINYQVKLNSGEYSLVGNNVGGYQQFSLQNAEDGENLIYVVTIGDNIKNISSDPAVITVNRLAAPTNLQTTNGVITWDMSQGVKYKVYVNNDEEGVEVLTNTYEGISEVGQLQTVKVKAIPTEGNYISSALAVKQVVKLNNVNSSSMAVTKIADSNTTSNYKLTWQAVENATKYDVKIYGKANQSLVYYYQNIENTYIQIPETYSADDYVVTINAVGNTSTEGVGYINSNASNFEFKKLTKAINLAIENNKLVWGVTEGEAPTGFTLEIEYKGITTYVDADVNRIYTFNSTYQLGDINVRIRSVGNASNLITSEYSEVFTFSRVSTVSNLRIANGSISWNRNTGVSYTVYGTNTPEDPTSVRELNASIQSWGSTVTCTLTELQENVEYKIYVIAKQQGKLDSLNSNELTVTKLPMVSNFKLLSGTFSWDQVANAESYVVVDNNNNRKTTNTTSLEFSSFNHTLNGTYLFNVYAVGTTYSTTVGYLNSNTSAITEEVTILATPNSAQIRNNILTLTNTNEIKPTKYRVEFEHSNGRSISLETEDVTVNLDDVNFTEGAGTYTIRIYSVGNNQNLLTSVSPLVLNNITKINEATLGLKIINGEITWTADGAKKYDVYVDGVKTLENVTTNVARITTLQKGVKHQITIVAKQDGAISSAQSAVLEVEKLPDITNFKIVETVTNANTGERSYKFTWDVLGGSYATNATMFKYEVSSEIEPFNGETENGAINNVSLNYASSVNGNFKFNIKAVGNGESTTFGYVTGDELANDLVITILKQLVFTSYNRANNSIVIQNNNQNASGILIAYENESGNFVKTNTIGGDAISFVLDTQSLTPGVYKIYFNCLGDVNNNIIMNSGIVSKSIEFLATPTNLRLDKGYLSWTPIAGENVAYQIYVGEGIVPFPNASESYVGPADAKIKVFNSYITDSTEHDIKIKAIKDGAIDSVVSDKITVKKLQTITDAAFNNFELHWSTVPNATGYVIKCVNTADMATLFGSAYSAEYGGIYVSGVNAGVEGYSFANMLTQGTYRFKVIPIGSTGVIATDSIGYLTGEESNIAEIVILPNTNSVYVNSGQIYWEAVNNAAGYAVNVYKTTQNQQSVTLVKSYTTKTNTYCLDDDQVFNGGFYRVSVRALGDGKNTFHAHYLDVAEIDVYKATAPNNYKVIDGVLTYSVSFNSDYMLYINGGSSYSDQQKNSVMLAIAGNKNVSEALIKNVQMFNNLEVTINDKVYSNQRPSLVKFDENKEKIIFTYDFNFSQIQNPYTVKIKFLGNTVTPSAGVGEVEVPVLNGVYSHSITGFKLIAPQSPVSSSEGATMVYNDSLYFSKVYADGYDVNYLITATCSNALISKVNFVIDDSNKANYLASTDDGVGGASTSIYKVPIADLGLTAGYVYTLTVRALGTADSGTNTEGVYFTSTYNGGIDVEVLQKSVVKINDGLIQFTQIPSAVGINLRIWSTSIGDVYDKSKSDRQNGKIVETITVNEEVDLNNNFIHSNDGYYYYSLSNNELFPEGSYYVTVEAVGNGVNTISSGVSPIETNGSATMVIYKLGNIEGVGIQAGKFKWNVLKYNKEGVSFDAAMYQVIVLRKLVSADEYDFDYAGLEYLNASEITSEDGMVCYYDLDSLKYPATDGEGNVYEYSINVRGYGTSFEGSTKYSRNVVNGNSTDSNYYKRLLAPATISMQNGVLTWEDVANSVKFEVYILDNVYEELQSYGVITDGNFRQLYYDGANLSTNAIINLRVRAIPGSESTQYLNGEFSIEIWAKKLETPNLRIVDGVIRWDNTDLNYSIATGTSVKISKLENSDDVSGEVVFENSNVEITNPINTNLGYVLEGTDAELPSGYYKAEVSYVGSNGEVNIPTIDNTPTPQTEGEEEVTLPTNYNWFSSNAVSMVIYKLPTPEANRYIENNNNDPKNYVSVAEVENASYYVFTALKYVNGEVVKTVTFDKYKINTEQQYFETKEIEGVTYVMFNLQAVSDNDLLNPDDTYKFGQEYSVYVQVFGENRKYDYNPNIIYSISNKSGEVAVEVPVTPTDLSVDASTGLITWNNYSNNTKTKIKVHYNNAVDPVIYTVDEGIEVFKLETIGHYSVSVLSFVTAQNGLEIASSYTDEVVGEFELYNRGSGSQTDPYIITTFKELLNVDKYLEAHFELGQTIELTEEDYNEYNGIIIGREGGVFTGTFSGGANKYGITNIKFARSAKEIALFAEIGLGAEVKNLKVGILTNGNAYTDVLQFAGVALKNYGTISNVETIEGTITYNCVAGQQLSGFVFENWGTIENSVNNLSIKYLGSGSDGMSTIVSGITTRNHGIVTHSGNKANLTGTTVAGVVFGNYGTITQCYNTGNISAISNRTGVQARAGGIAVMNLSTGVIDSCYAILNSFVVSNKSDGSFAGGIITDNQGGVLTQSYVAFVNQPNIANTKFGIFVGSDNRTNVANYYVTNFYYVAASSYQTLGSNSSVSIATITDSVGDLTLKLLDNCEGVYKEVNSGQDYPQFAWQ